jgi:hypothetical protein
LGHIWKAGLRAGCSDSSRLPTQVEHIENVLFSLEGSRYSKGIGSGGQQYKSDNKAVQYSLSYIRAWAEPMRLNSS